MGKFQLRKPKIISKNFPEVGSHIDNVSKSLEDIVFSYSEQVDKALQKKHMMMALSTLVLVLVVGSFISPRGKADIATFYPETCLGGWLNPRNAEKEFTTTSNADPSQFNDKNSAILDKNTHADIYCGNFNGTFNDATQPTKIIVSFALTNKGEITLGVATTTLEVVTASTSTTTDVTATTTEALLISSSTDATTTTEVMVTDLATTTEAEVGTSTQEAASFVTIVVDAVAETIANLFTSGTPPLGETDTVVVPVPVETQEAIPAQEPATTGESVPVVTPSEPVVPAATDGAPTSFFDSLLNIFTATFITTVFAEESEAPAISAVPDTPADTVQDVATPELAAPLVAATSSEVTQDEETISGTSSTFLELINVATTTDNVATTTATTTEEVFSLASSTATSTLSDVTTSSTTVVEEEANVQNNFLEILYTFDGVTWVSLGELNEISMKYRTFEIPLSASSTWSDMSQLQIKVATKSLESETPVVYLDGIKVEVLYDSPLEYTHPDFVRDTILKDETVDGVRLVTIINNETNEEEIWYMYLDDEVVTSSSTDLAVEVATTSLATSTSMVTAVATTSIENIAQTATTSELLFASSTQAVTTFSTSTDIATSSSSTVPVITPVIPKNKWFKLEKREAWASLSAKELVEEIKKEDKKEVEEKKKEDRLPDFALDVIRKIKGALRNAVIVQIEKEGKEELWLYDLENGGQYKIETGSSTSITIAKDMQLGLKESHVFWLSEDKKNVYAYNLIAKSILNAEIPPYDQSTGERGRVSFEGIPWEVVIGSEDFAFYSDETGEVFSDDNGAFAEALRQKLDLDKVLDNEELGNLNLQVTESGEATKTVSE